MYPLAIQNNQPHNNETVFYNIKTKHSKKRNDTKYLAASVDEIRHLKNKPNDIVSLVKNRLNKTKIQNKKLLINRSTGHYFLGENIKKINNRQINLLIQEANVENSIFLFKKKLKPTKLNVYMKQIINNKEDYIIRSKKHSESPLNKSISSDTTSLQNTIINCYWQEGHFKEITEFISLSAVIKAKYSEGYSSHENQDKDVEDTLNKYILGLEESFIENRTIVYSWESVKKRIEEIEEKTRTRYIYHYKTPNFEDKPQPFKKVRFELNTIRKHDMIRISNNGVPFIFIGIYVYSCHLAKQRNCKLSDNEAYTKIKSKKIGCPALIRIIKIARFPDFDISNLSFDATEDVLKELQDAWDFHTSKVRYYIEYHIQEPSMDNHQGHEVQTQVNNNRFQEAVDPRIIIKIKEIVKSGMTYPRIIQPLIKSYVESELFNGKHVPTDRRRYNPSLRDIQYSVFKAKEEMSREAKSALQVECCDLAEEIVSRINSLKNEQELNTLKSQLAQINSGLEAKQPNDREVEASFKPTLKKRKVSVDTMKSEAQQTVCMDEITVPIFDQATQEFYINIPVTVVNSTVPSETAKFNINSLISHDLTEDFNNQVELFPITSQETIL